MKGAENSVAAWCIWAEVSFSGSGYYETACGKVMDFEDCSDYHSKGFIFCPFCGSLITEDKELA